MNQKKSSAKLIALILLTILSFCIAYFCLSNEIYTSYQYIFLIPIVLSCFFYGIRGVIFSVVLSVLNELMLIYYPPAINIREIIVSFMVTVCTAVLIEVLSQHIKNQKKALKSLYKMLQNDLERFNKSEKLCGSGNWELNLKSNQMKWSDGLYRIFGFEPQSFPPVIEKRLELTHPDDRNFVKSILEIAIKNKTSVKIESRIIRPDGAIRWILSAGFVEHDEYGIPQTYYASFLDITEIKSAEISLAEEREKYKITVASIGDGVISTDEEGSIVILNKVAEKFTGWKKEDAKGKPLGTVLKIVDEKTGQPCECPIPVTANALSLEKNAALISKNGTMRYISESVAPIKDKNGNLRGTVLVLHDITEERRRQERINYISYHDILTGLYNRRYFEEQFKRIDTPENLPVSVIMGDVNALKLTNDAMGHAKGDELLQKTALAIKRACRKNDIAARWGGDEFVILLSKTSQSSAESVVSRICKIASGMDVNGIAVSVSFGWDAKVNQLDDLKKVLKRAESRMYENKVANSDAVRGMLTKTIINAMRNKDPDNEKHSERVSELCEKIGKEMHLNENELRDLKTAAFLHDIGKIAISNSILKKEGKLTDSERIEIKRHSEIGYRILKSSKDTDRIAGYVLSQHERYDGYGYPDGLKGDEIPLISRIIFVADAYDVMTNNWAYRKAIWHDAAVEELEKERGRQFDPTVVDNLLKIFVRSGKTTM